MTYFLISHRLFISYCVFVFILCILFNDAVSSSEGRRPLGRPRRRWEGNIKMDLREIRFGDVDWIHWDQDRDR
jgi:hypothetical protein